MKNVSDFLPFVLPYAPGCSDPMAEQAIVSACMEFCERSLIVQETLGESSAADQADYDVSEPAQGALVKVLAVFYLDARLKARSREMVRRGSAARGEAITGVTVTSGTPVEWFSRDPAQPIISLYPPPAESEEGAITIVAAFRPTRAATRVADTLYDDYAEDIAAGAIARLLIMPAQSFTSPSLAGTYRSQFLSAVHAASTLARVGLGATASRVQPGFFA